LANITGDAGTVTRMSEKGKGEKIKKQKLKKKSRFKFQVTDI